MSSLTQLTSSAQLSSSHGSMPSGQTGQVVPSIDMFVTRMVSSQQAAQLLRTQATVKTNEVLLQQKGSIEELGRLVASLKEELAKQEIQSRQQLELRDSRIEALTQQLSTIQQQQASDRSRYDNFMKKMIEFFKQHCHPDGPNGTPQCQDGMKTIQVRINSGTRAQRTIPKQVHNYKIFNWAELEVPESKEEQKK